MPGEKSSRAARKELAQLNEDTKTRIHRLEEALINEAAGFETPGMVVSQSSELQFEAHAGPLPHPELSAAYERVLPGAADRIITMAERQQTHRHELESVAINGGSARARQGLAAGFVVTLAFLLASVWLVSTGHDVGGGVIGTVDLVALVSIFVIGQKSQSDERARKRKERRESGG